MEFILLLMIPLAIFLLVFQKKKKWKVEPLNEGQKLFLSRKVEFYRELNHVEKKEFENRIQHFLSTTRIIGVDTDVNDKDKLLVAASAIIPVFSFPKWEYINLKEVLLYNSSFNENYSTKGDTNQILGMVGSGAMEGKMILSKPSLHQGFSNANDKKNVGIHEFIHLIDKSDGVIDGIPSLLLDKQFTIPWLNLIKEEMEAIHSHRSDINPYGGVSKEEFFPVISEYFFERPKLLKSKHPELYKIVNEIFTTDLATTYKGKKENSPIGRNDLCPCGSGKKYKNCCLTKSA